MTDTLLGVESYVISALNELAETSSEIVHRNRNGKSCLVLATEMEDVVHQVRPVISGLDGYDISTGYIFNIDVLGDPENYTHFHAYNFIAARNQQSGDVIITEADGYDQSIADSSVYCSGDLNPAIALSEDDPKNSVVYTFDSDKVVFKLAKSLREVPLEVPYERQFTRGVYLGEVTGRLATQELIRLSNPKGEVTPDKSLLPVLLLGK